MEQYTMVSPNGQLYAAVSGGRDSMAMLHALCMIARQIPFSLTVLHVDHMLREQSAEDADFVQRICKDWHIPCLVERVDVAKRRQKGESLEQAARRMRYAFFARVCQANPGVVAVAHHQEDQAETILMHLLRGTGLRGLCGMQPKRDWLIRPLLYTNRATIEAYIREHQIPFCEDASNADCRFTRNRIRHRLIPYLQTEFNPQIVPALARMAQNVAEDEALLDQWTQQAVSEVQWEGQRGKWIRMRTQAFVDQPISVQKRLLWQALEQLGITDMRQTMMQSAIETMQSGGHARLSPQCQIWSGTYVELCMDAMPFSVVAIETGQSVQAGCGSITARVRTGSMARRMEELDANTICLDVQKLTTPILTARPRRRGDKIHLKVGSKSISDVLTDRKIAHGLRDRLPVVCDGDRILWMPEVVRSDYARIDAQTDQILELQWTRDP